MRPLDSALGRDVAVHGMGYSIESHERQIDKKKLQTCVASDDVNMALCTKVVGGGGHGRHKYIRIFTLYTIILTCHRGQSDYFYTMRHPLSRDVIVLFLL